MSDDEPGAPRRLTDLMDPDVVELLGPPRPPARSSNPTDWWDHAVQAMKELGIERRTRTSAANAARHAVAARRRARALEMREAGLSVPQIGMRMAREDDRPDNPYPETTVRRWLRKG